MDLKFTFIFSSLLNFRVLITSPRMISVCFIHIVCFISYIIWMYCIFVFDFVWFAAQQNEYKKTWNVYIFNNKSSANYLALVRRTTNKFIGFHLFCSDSFRIFVVTDVLNWRKITLMHNLSWKCEFNWKLCFLLFYKLKLINKNYYWISVSDRMWLFPALFHFLKQHRILTFYHVKRDSIYAIHCCRHHHKIHCSYWL